MRAMAAVRGCVTTHVFGAVLAIVRLAAASCAVLQVDVMVPDDHMGDVIGDLNSRRGAVDSFTDRPGGMKLVQAQARIS